MHKINKAQYEAITHNEGPALVIAGPGSGKTFVITQRIKYLIERHHVAPEEILVITFTKSAASEMRERFLQVMNQKNTNVSFGTFHAIFFHILKQAYHYRKENILTETEKYSLLKEAMGLVEFSSESASEHPLLQGEYMQLIISEISALKNEGKGIESYDSQVVEPHIFREIYSYYQKILAEHRKVDFDDMVLQCYQLFRQRADILQGWRQRYKYILIDEFQDICAMQFKVVRLLAAPLNNIFIVGDDDQSIYRFRGASPSIMLRFPELYPNAKKIFLNINYRCHKEILDTAMSLISHNHERFQKEIIPNNLSVHQNEIVSYRAFSDKNEQCEAIMSYVSDYIKNGGNYNDIAILYRTNIEASHMAERCIAHHIPFEMKEKMQNIYAKFYVQDVIAYMKFALGDYNRKLFYQIMNKPVRYIQRIAVTGQHVNKEELLQYYHDKEYVYRAIEQLWMQLTFLKEMSPFAAINYIRKGIGYEAYLENLSKDNSSERKEWLEKLDEIQNQAKQYEMIGDWLSYIEEYETKIKTVGKTENNGIEIMTMHAAKGLEWKQVWIPDLNEGIIPHKKADFQADLEEERRLLYVALTRAKERLILSSIGCGGKLEVKKENETRKMQSRFLKEMGFDFDKSFQ